MPLNSLSKVDASTGQAPELDFMAHPGISDEPASCATEDLMKRVQRGDMYAFQEIIRRYQKKVFRVISTYLRNPEDAMEVLQDTFLKVYTARQTWESRYSFAGWLYRIAINASIDRYRRSDRTRTSSLEGMMETKMHQSFTGNTAQNQLERVRSRERRRILEEAVRHLPHRQREVVSLRYFGEMKLEEIASVLGCPLGTIKSNLHKAVMGLKAMLLEQKGVLSYE
jgi:RNA polymerase sigma-70 factor (ECF subfamily)